MLLEERLLCIIGLIRFREEVWPLASSGAAFDLALSIFILPVWPFLLKARQAIFVWITSAFLQSLVLFLHIGRIFIVLEILKIENSSV